MADAAVPYADDPDIGEVIVSTEELAARIAELGASITEDYAGRAPLLVGVLKGAFLFMADLPCAFVRGCRFRDILRRVHVRRQSTRLDYGDRAPDNSRSCAAWTSGMEDPPRGEVAQSVRARDS